MEICTSIVSEIVKSFINEAIHQANYPFRFKRYVKDLVKEKENLLAQKESIDGRVTKAKQDALKIDILVTQWLDEADTLIVDAVLLEEKAKANKSCFFGHCPNWIWRCHLAKQIEKKTKEMANQGDKCKFELFARPATPPDITYYSSKGFFLFDSTKSAYGQLLEALKDVDVSMIGLYGMGGCGKTTLAKQVGIATKDLFNRVVFVVISSSVDVSRIQDSLASELGVTLKGHDNQAKAKSL
ncbi:putative disease resistance protein At4g10780 [Prosopis cineraria]|uniref:putative disease resistance protein At4g10780 n=1 Tax=Prosopis cineraria TaxID=364024 RepID=UPI00240FBBAA|nr:putative disease resistance protein At4g10780 [Prosopis cineraria]